MTDITVKAVADLASFTPAGASWEGRETDEEAGLEGWVEALALAVPESGVRAALACCEVALPVAIAGFEASGMGFADPRSGDSWGSSVTATEQVDATRAWLADGRSLASAIDYTRQLNVWDDDLRPTTPESWYAYFVEAANLLAMGAEHGLEKVKYEGFTGAQASARAAVCAYKSMNHAGADRTAQLMALIMSVGEALR